MNWMLMNGSKEHEEMTKEQEWYRRYLKCEHWQMLRLEVLKRSGGACEICGFKPYQRGNLQVHHLTYSNVGNEKLDDLIVVCPRCHMELHGITGRRKPENMKKNN